MYAKSTDVVVHVNEPLAADRGARLERALESSGGVVQASASPHARQLLIVRYRPEVMSAFDVLRFVEAQGFTARLVGM
jgi:hypothetical protein